MVVERVMDWIGPTCRQCSVLAIVYAVAGIIWIAPLRPLLIWMETGSFKAPPEVS